MKKYILLLSLITLVACESPPLRREEMLAEHPEWLQESPEIVDAIRRGYLLKGMSKEQVRAAWGRPCYTCTGTVTEKDWGSTWEYQTQIVFFDRQGKLTRWNKK